MDTFSQSADPSLYNSGLAPVSPATRTWGAYNFACLWISMSICVPTYMLASGLIAGGMSWREAIGTILLGNLIVLVPMLLNGHAGTAYGIPYPVLARASFGVRGANIPAVLRALIGCGWFGIQTWIGGQAIHTMLSIAWPALARSEASLWICFGIFWAVNIYVVWKGLEFIRVVENASAPFLLVMGLVLLGWVVRLAGGMGPVLSSPGRFRSGLEFWRFFVPSLTAMVGFWATVALNIPDFTRYARTQRAQAWGQAMGLPTSMTLFAFIGVAVTSASVLIFGEAVWDPIVLIARLGRPVVALVALLVVATATLTTNIAANIVPPANDFANLNPRRISFRTGVLATGIIGVVMMPWKLLSSANAYIFGWLVGYSSLLGPVTGIIITDYIVLRRRKLDVNGLYSVTGPYAYVNGVNWCAVQSLAAGVVVPLCGLVLPPLRWLYDYAWFIGFGISGVFYYACMRRNCR
ncbi:MAG: NCS1 family nucleobase:cation symporter-1 [Bryobacteraceae bacterium]